MNIFISSTAVLYGIGGFTEILKGNNLMGIVYICYSVSSVCLVILGKS